MPFKFKIRKTRHYSVISRNVLVLTVELIDKTTLECTLSANSTGLDCLHHVCQRLNLLQPEFFGLRYMCKRPYPKVRWVEMERPLKKQLEKYAQSLSLSVAVQFYIHDVGVLQDEISRTHYFLQVKQDVLDGKMRCNYEQAVLLASYSLQADFGDHQPERHTSEYLREFRLFPKHVMSEGEVKSLLDAVVWQYSSLNGLSQALAETYYILEAQRLPGYGQETFIARDDKGSEVYLGASLLGIVVESAAGARQTFFRWNDITNLVNHKRSFGIECGLMSDPVRFVFEEPDAAKYVWKMCVKQHTFFKRNQELPAHGGGGALEPRSLVIPDLQQSSTVPFSSSRVMDSTFSTLSHSHQEPTSEIQSSSSHQFVSPPNVFNSSFRKSDRRTRLPLYRNAPDYEAAILHKYGAGMSSDRRVVLFYSSQPEISPREALSKGLHDEELEGPLHHQIASHRQANNGEVFDRGDWQDENRQHLSSSGICSTYSTPELNVNSSSSSAFRRDCDLRIFQGCRPPPPYPFCKSSSNSTPDLVSAYKAKPVNCGLPADVKSSSNNRTSLASCLGSPKLSRTYENVSNLSDAVESLRHELVEGKASFLHSVPPSYSTDNLNSVYHVPLGQSFNIKNSGLPAKVSSTPLESGTEPIYQNVESLIADVVSRQTEIKKSVADVNTKKISSSGGVPTNRSIQADNHEFTSAPSEPIHLDFSVPNNKCIPSSEQWSVFGTQLFKSKPSPTITQVAQRQFSQHLIRPRSPAHAASSHLAENAVVIGQSQNIPSSPNNSTFFVRSPPPPHEGSSKILSPPAPLSDPSQGQFQSPEEKMFNSNVKKLLRTTSQHKDPKITELEAKLSGMEVNDEFNSISLVKENADFSSALRPDNEGRNRVKDVLPYEENRVKLTPSKDNRSGYINASHLTASIGKNQRFYVCAQGPLSKTVLDFWQCVWETDARLIVALVGHPLESDAKACRIFPYWPQTDNTSVECDHFRVLRKQSARFGSHVTCQLQLVHMKHRKSRSLWHLQFHAWNREDECPENISDFLSFLEELSSLRQMTSNEMDDGGVVGLNRNPPVMVHCSSGAGRSGLVILSDILTEAARHNVPLEPAKLLAHLRCQRMSLIQSVLQYRFAFKILISSFQSSRLI